MRTFTILTGPPSRAVAALHDRQPVVVPARLRAAWLAPGELDPGVFEALRSPYEALAIEGGGVQQLGLFEI